MINLEIIGTPSFWGDLKSLENYRFTNGRRFPTSYQNFVKRFGYGKVLGEWIFYIPMGNYGDSWDIRSEEIRSTYYDDVMQGDVWFDLDPDVSIEILKHLIPFASSENGYYLFWDIESHPSNDEFDILITDFRGSGFRKIATSIDELFAKMTNRFDFKEILPFRQEPYPPIFECIEKNR